MAQNHLRSVQTDFQPAKQFYIFMGRYVPMALYYVDFENVHAEGLKGIEDLDRKDEVRIYCREMDVKGIEIRLKQKKIKALVKCVIVRCRTKNALDFELISDLFMEKKDELRFIVSKDKGYDVAIERGLRNGILCFRKISINDASFLLGIEYYRKECSDVRIL